MKVLITATIQSFVCVFQRAHIEMLHDNKCEVHVAAKDNLADKDGLKLDFADKIYEIPFARSPFSKSNIKAYKELKQLIDEGGYDIIHCNTPVGGIITRLAARKARRKGAKVIYTAHGFHFYQGAPLKNWMVYYPIERFFANRHTDTLITINQEDYTLAKSKFKCRAERMNGVGVDANRYYPVDAKTKAEIRKSLGYDENQSIIICVGELNSNKNQQMIIRTMAELVKREQNALLLIAGIGPWKKHLDALVEELELEDNVKFLGYKSNIEEYYHISDVLVSCSIREGLPFNVIEAMLSGLPVIASNNRGHRELITHGENGFLFSDQTELNEYVESLILNRIKFIDIAKANYDKSKEYCSERIKKEFQNIYGFNAAQQ